MHHLVWSVLVALLVGACSGNAGAAPATASAAPSTVATPAPSRSPSPVPTASPAASVDTTPPLTQAQMDWCTIHTGGPTDDLHAVEDMAIQLGVIPGAKTREDIFGRWAGHTMADSAADPTYKAACVAAYAKFASPSPS